MFSSVIESKSSLYTFTKRKQSMMYYHSFLCFVFSSLGIVRGEVLAINRGNVVDANEVSDVLESLPENFLNSYGLEYHQDIIENKVGEFAGSLNTLNTEEDNGDASSSISSPDIPSAKLRRNLLDGYFDEFQDMLQQAVASLPDFEASDWVAGKEMELEVTNILCREITFGDMVIDYEKRRNKKLAFEVNIQDIDLKCDMDFGWSFGTLSGGGQATARTVDSYTTTLLEFTSQDFDQYPPNPSYKERCNVCINVADLQYTGSVPAEISSEFESIILNRLSLEIQSTSCVSLSTSSLGDSLKMAREAFDKYAEPLEPWRLSPTYPEQLINIPNGVQLVNFNDANGVGRVLVDGIDQANWYFSTWFNSLEGPNERDLGINVFLRQNVLDNNRGITLRVNDLPNFDPLLFHGQDRLTETRITLDSIKLFGLDTFTKFEPVLGIGKYTHQVDLHWEFLTVQADATVHVELSTQKDSLLEHPGPISITEKIQIDFGVDDVDAVVAILLAMDQEALEQLEVGSFLVAQQIIPCLLSTIRNVGISGLNVSVGNVRKPTTTGFMSRSIDDIVTRSVEAAFLMYESVVIRSMPSFFQTTVRDLVTENLIDFAFKSRCRQATVVDETIDFRDLFLDPSNSVEFGGYGDERYGDIVEDVFTFLRNQFTVADDDGLLQINSMIIRPLTERQSGFEGMLRLSDSNFFNINIDDLLFDSLERLEFSLSDARIENLDTFVSPTEIFGPTKHPQSLSNAINFGSLTDGSLNTTVTMNLNLVGKGSRPSMFSEIDIAVGGTSLELMTDLLAVISSPKLLHFPLKDISNIHCWLSTIVTPKLDQNGIRYQLADNFGVSFQTFLARSLGLEVDAFCRNCTVSDTKHEGRGAAFSSTLQELMKTIHESQSSSIIDDRLGTLVEEVMVSDFIQNVLDRWLVEASRICPHNTSRIISFWGNMATTHNSGTENTMGDFSESMIVTKSFEIQNMPPLPLSSEAVDTILFTAATALHVGFILLTDIHQMWPTESLDTSLIQQEFDAPEDIRLLDWMKTEDSFSPVVNFAFEETKKFLNSWSYSNPNRKLDDVVSDNVFDDTGLGLWPLLNNNIFGGLLGSDGNVTIVPNNFEYDIAGLALKIHSVRISGLDSFTRLNLLDAISPQILKNSMRLAKLSFELDISMDSKETIDEPPQHIKVSLVAEDVDITLPLFVALDLDLFDALELGSLLRSSGILPCIASTIYDMHTPQVLVSLGKLHQPLIEGFMPATQSAASNLTASMFKQFSHGGRIEEGFAFVLENSLRPWINRKISSFATGSRCDQPNIVDETIDFRDLFLDPSDSVEFGGYGDERYGDIVEDVFTFLRNQFTVADDDGLLQINSMIIRPLAERQSGFEGMLRLSDSNFFNINIDDLLFDSLERLEFSLSDARIENLDTFVSPTEIFGPTKHPQSLSNAINFGSLTNGSLNTTVTMNLNLVGKGSRPSMFSEIDITVGGTSLELMTDLLAVISSPKLLHFPLKDISNIHCWLSTIVTPKLDQNGIRYQLADNFGVSFQTFLARSLGLEVDAFCRNCTVSDIKHEGRGAAFSSTLQELMKTIHESQSSSIIDDRLGTLVEEVMVSDFIQNVLDRWLVEASRICPHITSRIDNTMGDFSESMIVTKSFEIQNMPPLPLSSEAVDTILFTAATALHVGFILLTDIHQMWPTESLDTSLIQQEFDAPEDIRLLDWMKTEDSFSPVVNFAFEETKKFLNSWSYSNPNRKLDDVVSDNVFDDTGLGLWPLLNNNIFGGLLGSDGNVTIVPNNFEYDIAGLALKIHSVRISGLDSFTRLNLLDAISPQILKNSMRLAKLSFELDISMDSKETIDEPPQHIKVSLVAEDVDITLPLFVALDLDLFDTLELGSLLRSSGILPCIASTIYDMHTPQVLVSLGKLHQPLIEGFMPATQSAASNLTASIFKRFSHGGRIEEGFAFVLENSLRPWINRKFSSYIADSRCNNFLSEDSNTDGGSSSQNRRGLESTKIDNGHIDFRDLLLSAEVALEYGGSGDSPYGDVFYWMFDFFRKVVLPVDQNTSLSAVSNLIGPLVESISGRRETLYFADDLFNYGVKIGGDESNAEVGLRFFDAEVQNIDQIGAPLSLFDPVVDERYQLNNTVTAGAATVPFRFMARVFVEILQQDGIQIVNDMAVTADFYALTLFLTTLIKISEEKFAKFPIRDLSNMHCWLATIPSKSLDKHGVRAEGLEDPSTAGIKNLAASVARLNLNLNCLNCTSPEMEEFAEILSLPSMVDALTAEANNVLNYVAEKIGGKFAQVQIDRLINDAPRHCPHDPQYEVDAKPVYYQAFQREMPNAPISYIALFPLVAGSLLIIVATIVLVVRLIVRRRHQKWLSSLPRQRLFALQKQQTKEDQTESELNFLTKSMFQSSTIPLFVRMFIPVVILGNIALFLSGHLNRAAAVTMKGELAGEHFLMENLFEFSVGQSIIDIWQAGGRVIAILILILSGIWPYAKQLVTLVLWFLPPTILPIHSRGSTLLWLDALAKWSMVDIFTLLVSMAAFRISIVSQDRDFIPEDFYSIHLMVVPKWGLYANLIAQLISQVSSHYIIYYHRRLVSEAKKRYEMRRQILGEGSSYYRTDSKADAKADYTDDGNTIASDNSSEDGENSMLMIKPAAKLPWSGNGGVKNGGNGAGVVTTRARIGTGIIGNSIFNTATTTVDQTKDQLCRHAFTRPHRGEFDRLVIRRCVNYLFCAAMVLFSTMLILGCCVYPTFASEVLGLVGVFMEYGQEDASATKTEHSVLGMAKLIMDQANLLENPADSIGLGTLSFLFLLSTLVVPLIQIVALAFQWFYPMRKKLRSKICVLVEILHAWQYAEVYIISVLVATWQFASVSEFMIHAYCDSLNDTLAKLRYYGILDAKDAQCFQVETSIEVATYLILTSSIILTLLNTFTMKAAKQYFRDNDGIHRRCVQSSLSPSSSSLMLPYKGDNNNKFENEQEFDIMNTTAAAAAAGITSESIVRTTVRPVPVLFTDTFRWLLVREDSVGLPGVTVGRMNNRDRDDDTVTDVDDDLFENELLPPSFSGQYHHHHQQQQDSRVQLLTTSPDVERGLNTDDAPGNVDSVTLGSNTTDQEQSSNDRVDIRSNNLSYNNDGMESNLQEQTITTRTADLDGETTNFNNDSSSNDDNYIINDKEQTTTRTADNSDGNTTTSFNNINGDNNYTINDKGQKSTTVTNFDGDTRSFNSNDNDYTIHDMEQTTTGTVNSEGTTTTSFNSSSSSKSIDDGNCTASYTEPTRTNTDSNGYYTEHTNNNNKTESDDEHSFFLLSTDGNSSLPLSDISPPSIYNNKHGNNNDNYSTSSTGLVELYEDEYNNNSSDDDNDNIMNSRSRTLLGESRTIC